MHKGLIISLLAVALVVGIVSDRTPDTSPELYPLASAIGWVEGHGRALDAGLLGAGIKPVNTMEMGRSIITRTPPAMMLYYGAVTRIFHDIVGRDLDGADLPRLSWWINFLGVLPWALILFFALYRLAGIFGCVEPSSRLTAAWASVMGSLCVGWFGTVSPYLPVAALTSLGIFFLLSGVGNSKPINLFFAGILFGISGAAHPSGWIWAVLGPAYLFITLTGPSAKDSGKSLVFMLAGLVISIAIVLAGNFLFFASVMPVQFINVEPADFDSGRLIALAWHDIIGWNGILWLSPLIIPGIIGLLNRGNRLTADTPLLLLIGVTAVILIPWGISEDSRVIGEQERLHPAFAVVPIELTEGKFSIVEMEPAQGSEAESRAYYEMVFQRTDVFIFNGGRGVGLPIFIQASCLLSLIGWIRFVGTRISGSVIWVLVRLGGLAGIIISMAPYGGVSSYYLYIGLILNGQGTPVYGQAPFIEALMAMMVRLAELWPSGVVQF